MKGVFDEADMLPCESFQNQIIQPIHMLSFDEKLLSRMADITEEPKTYETDEPQVIMGLAKLTSVMKMTLKTRNF